MYIALILPENYANNEIKELINLYRMYYTDMSPLVYTTEEVKCIKKHLKSTVEAIDMLNAAESNTDENELRPIFIVSNKAVSIIKNQINNLTVPELMIMSAILKRITDHK